MPIPGAPTATRDWWVSPGGNVWEATGPKAELLKIAGWSGPMTHAEAEVIAGTTPAPLRDLNKFVTHPPNPTESLAAAGDFFHRLTEPQTWTRVGEVALGGILVYAGIRALTHGSSTVGVSARKSATRPARKAAGAAASVVVPEARLASRAIAKKAAPKATARVAAHRANVAKYGAKKPYQPPPPKAPRQPTVRVSHIYHHKGPAKP